MHPPINGLKSNAQEFMYRHRYTVLLVFLYGCALLQFVRFYVASTTFYLKLPAYLSGHERLPFQERILPVLFIKPLTQSAWVRVHLVHSNGAFTLERGPFYLLSLIALAVAAVYTQRLYESVSPGRPLRALVFPIFLFAVMWTYTIHSEANYSYPYDLPSLAFFTAGLYYIYRRRFLPLLLVVLIGSFNRETTLFLIGIYVLDTLSPANERSVDEEQPRFNLRLMPWARAALLCLVWLGIKLLLAHRFAGNDTSESFLRIHYNLDRFKLRLFPAMLNICGYTLPLVVLFHRYLPSRRFANYLLILIPWFGIMFCSGVLVETRIYGELCSFSAVALVLILENYLSTHFAPRQHESRRRAVGPRPSRLSHAEATIS